VDYFGAAVGSPAENYAYATAKTGVAVAFLRTIGGPHRGGHTFFGDAIAAHVGFAERAARHLPIFRLTLGKDRWDSNGP